MPEGVNQGARPDVISPKPVWGQVLAWPTPQPQSEVGFPELLFILTTRC